MNVPPVIAPIMRERPTAFILALIPLVFVVLDATDVFHWKCPFFAFTNLPCPGCGMTHAVMSLVQLELSDAIEVHPLSPLLLLGWLAWVIISIVPSKQRLFTIEKIEFLERKSGVVYLILALFIVFGLVRLLLTV